MTICAPHHPLRVEAGRPSRSLLFTARADNAAPGARLSRQRRAAGHRSARWPSTRWSPPTRPRRKITLPSVQPGIAPGGMSAMHCPQRPNTGDVKW